MKCELGLVSEMMSFVSFVSSDWSFPFLFGCKQRGTHTNHRHKDCRFKDGDQPSPKHPNLGKAPTKSKDNKSKRESSSQARPFATATANNDRRCYICNDLNHLSKCNSCHLGFLRGVTGLRVCSGVSSL